VTLTRWTDKEYTAQAEVIRYVAAAMRPVAAITAAS